MRKFSTNIDVSFGDPRNSEDAFLFIFIIYKTSLHLRKSIIKGKVFTVFCIY